MQTILIKGTQGSHLSVRISLTSGTAQTVSPIIIGAIIYVLVLIARLVMLFTLDTSPCSLDIVGKSTLSIDVLTFVMIRLGNCLPLLK